MGITGSFDLQASRFGVVEVVGVIALTFTIYVIGQLLYNIFLHPLSQYPGPPLAAATRLWYCYYCTQGTLIYAVSRAHEKYGDVVRIAPNELSYINAEAWNDIYGHRSGKRELMKDPIFFSSLQSGKGRGILSADRARHGLLRKQASHGFSERAMRSQEPVIKKYADLMIERLETCVASGEATVNMADWYNFFTFDVMGDLVFGQSFDCLTNWGYHPWVKLIFDSVKFGTLMQCTKYWAFLAPLAKWVIPADIRKRAAEQQMLALEKAEFRKSIDDGRQDLISGFLVPESKVTELEYQSTVQTLIIAGSETTATLMSGLTFYLLKDAKRMTKLKTEIREAFSTAEEIDYNSVNKLTYLLACLDEALRIHPPVAGNFPRNTGPEPETICGKVVPPWTTIGVHQWSAYHSQRSFKDPNDFIPERWIEGEKGYEDDNKAVVQAFHVGPRNCLGRNLAYFEMRIMIARVLWRFDLELDTRSAQWSDQKSFNLWEQHPLFVKLARRSV